MADGATARSVSLPAPVGGWNTRQALDAMSPYDAIRLINLFPEEDRVTLRRGYEAYVSSGIGSTPVKTLAEFVTAAGVHSFLCGANGNIYNVSTSTAASVGSGFSENAWQTLKFRSRLLFFNGTDQPQQWDGTTLSAAAYTGITDDADLIQATAYRSRLYIVQKNTTSFWYGATNAITGALTEYDVGGEFTLGGYLLFVCTWAHESGTNLTQNLVCVSSEGEAVCYSGASPDADAWAVVGKAHISKPMGRRAYLQRRADVEILTQEGLLPLSAVFGDINEIGTLRFAWDKIAPTFSKAAKLYSNRHGWEVCHYPRGKMILCNIPVVENSQSQQFVRNVFTGSWAQYTSMNASCWGVYNDQLYFGAMNGKIYKADSGQDDNNANIVWEIKTAFNYLNDVAHLKHFQMARPLLMTDGTMTMKFDVDVDFQNRLITDTVTVTGVAGSTWDVAEWDTATWSGEEDYITDWYAVSGLGRSVSLRMKGEAKDLAFSLFGVHLTYTPGGMI